MLRRPNIVHFVLTTSIAILSIGTCDVSAQENHSATSVPTAAAAIKGAEDSPAGETYGVVGTSASAAGAGIGAANLAGGADLVLDGSSDGQIDALLYHHQLDRPSAAPQTFDFVNSGGGGMGLMIDGIDVVTTATDRDTLGVLLCSPNQMPLWNGGTWSCIDRPAPRDPGQHLALNGNALDVVDGPASGLDADTLDGLEGEYYARNLQRVVTVSAFGGDFATVQGALDSITDAAAENRYLVKIGPGVYFEQVTMKPYVDIEGSGQDVTTIKWGDGNYEDGTIFGADHAELRQLTVERDTAFRATAMINDGTSPRLSFVTLRVADGTMRLALANHYSASPTVVNCLVEVTGSHAIGIENMGGTAHFQDVSINVAGDIALGVSNSDGCRATFEDVHIDVSASDSPNSVGIVSGGSSSPTMRECTVSVVKDAGGSVDNIQGAQIGEGSSLSLVNTEIAVGHADLKNIAVWVRGGFVDISQSRLAVVGPNPTGIYAVAVTKGAQSHVKLTSSSIDIDMGGILSSSCHSIYSNGANLWILHANLHNSNLVNCAQGVAVQIDNAADRVFLGHTFMIGSYSSTPGVAETCLAVSEWLIDPMFYPNTCP